MTGRQWIRRAALTVEGNGELLDLSDMHFKFAIHRMCIATPNAADVRVYNLADSTVERLRNSVGSTVTIQAGYQDSAFGVIYRGQIIQVRRGRESPVDTYVDILGSTWDKGYNFGVASQTLAAGSTAAERAAAISQSMGLSAPEGADFSSEKLPRGRVYFGMGRDYAQQLAASTGHTWSVQDDRNVMIPRTGYLPGEATVLNSATGLIGLPEQTMGGIMARCLINPNIRTGGTVKIDNTSIQELRLDPSPQGQAQAGLRPSIAMDGLYTVWAQDHYGDTRGQEWYSELLLLTVGEGNRSIVGLG